MVLNGVRARFGDFVSHHTTSSRLRLPAVIVAIGGEAKEFTVRLDIVLEANI